MLSMPAPRRAQLVEDAPHLVGAPREHGKAGPARDYRVKEIRHREMDYVERADRATRWLMVGRAPGDMQAKIRVQWRCCRPPQLRRLQ
jgi:hypothetical protein